jgi:hypothetical protein
VKSDATPHPRTRELAGHIGDRPVGRGDEDVRGARGDLLYWERLGLLTDERGRAPGAIERSGGYGDNSLVVLSQKVAESLAETAGADDGDGGVGHRTIVALSADDKNDRLPHLLGFVQC